MESTDKIEIQESGSKQYKEKLRSGLESAKWSIILIIVGLYFLLREFNILNDTVLRAIIKAWPLILVWIGIYSATKNNKRLRSLGMILVIAIFVFIVLHNIDLRLPPMK